MPRVCWIACITLLASACGDDSGSPGSLTATVVSPNGAEGSALVTVFGQGVVGVRALEGRVFSRQVGDTVRVVVVNPGGGTLRFTVDVDDVSRTPTAAVIEVADTENVLRALAGYEVEVTR